MRNASSDPPAPPDRDLFGAPVPRAPSRELVHGYASTPGLGPLGETCRSCAHSYVVQYAKRYWKCDLVKRTAGPGTDIRLKSPACRRWEKDEPGA